MFSLTKAVFNSIKVRRAFLECYKRYPALRTAGTDFRRIFKMNKNELISSIADKAGIKKTDAEKALKAFIETVTEELKNGEKVQLVGFGTFETAERPAREGRNPRTGETMKIEASKSPKFKAGKALKDAIN